MFVFTFGLSIDTLDLSLGQPLLPLLLRVNLQTDELLAALQSYCDGRSLEGCLTADNGVQQGLLLLVETLLLLLRPLCGPRASEGADLGG